MRKNRGKGIIFTIIGAVIGILIALAVLRVLPSGLKEARELIFFLIVALVGGGVTFLGARFTGGRR